MGDVRTLRLPAATRSRQPMIEVIGNSWNNSLNFDIATPLRSWRDFGTFNAVERSVRSWNKRPGQDHTKIIASEFETYFVLNHHLRC